ncbi:MAG: VOC family protein [Acidobacteriota bacterium]|jgi:catechol 2,3-dioxygenase-like lactoylglutathione lyase family enzyme
MKAPEILETCLYVDDLEAAERFYAEVLGLQFFAREEGRHVFFRCGSRMLLLFDPTATLPPGQDLPPHGTRGPGHLALGVPADSIPAWKSRLRERGVEIETEAEWPSGQSSIYFRDPAGNSIELAPPGIWGIAESDALGGARDQT